MFPVFPVGEDYKKGLFCASLVPSNGTLVLKYPRHLPWRW